MVEVGAGGGDVGVMICSCSSVWVLMVMLCCGCVGGCNVRFVFCPVGVYVCVCVCWWLCGGVMFYCVCIGGGVCAVYIYMFYYPTYSLFIHLYFLTACYLVSTSLLSHLLMHSCTI